MARWHECGEAYVRAIHRLTRGLDPTHPFSDVVWGVITAHDEAGAVTIAEETEPLAVRRVVSGTVEGVDLRAFQSGVAFNELVQRHGVVKVGPTVDDGSDAAGGVEVDVVSDATMAIKQEIEHPETDHHVWPRTRIRMEHWVQVPWRTVPTFTRDRRASRAPCRARHWP